MRANVKNKYRLRKQLQVWLYEVVEKYSPMYDISVSIDNSEKDSFTLNIEMSFSDIIPPLQYSDVCHTGAADIREHLAVLSNKLERATKEYEKQFAFAIESDREKSKLLEIIRGLNKNEGI